MMMEGMNECNSKMVKSGHRKSERHKSTEGKNNRRDRNPREEQRSIRINLSVPAGFEKLEGAGNFMDWKFAMEMHLFSCDLWDVVGGLKHDEYQNKQARCAIVSGIKPSLFSNIRDATTGTEIWNILEKLYQPRGLYRKVALLEELTSLKFTDCPDMVTYINRKVETAQRLKAIDGNIQDGLLAGMILMNRVRMFMH